MHVPPMQLSPIEHMFPQRPQLLESLMNDAWLMHEPMHEVYPGAHEHEPPVHDSEIEQLLPQRPQLFESLRKLAVLTQLPWQYSSPAGQSKGDSPAGFAGDGSCGRLVIACTGGPGRVIASAT